MMVDGDNSYSVHERMLMDTACLHSDKESVQMEKIHCVIDEHLLPLVVRNP